MTVEKIDQIKVTKTLLARLIGQIYDLSGFLAPIRATLLSLFSKVCLLLNDWSSALPPDNEVAANVTSVLKELAADLPLIKPMPRCKIPHGATLQRIIVFSDASLDVVAFAVWCTKRICGYRVIFSSQILIQDTRQFQASRCLPSLLDSTSYMDSYLSTQFLCFRSRWSVSTSKSTANVCCIL